MNRAHLGLAAPLLACSAALIAVPAAAGMRLGSPGGSGGAGLGPGDGSPARAAVQPADVTVSATADGITLATTASALVRHKLEFTGTAAIGDAGATVEIERLGPGTHRHWTATTSAIVGPSGTFSAAWPADASGTFSFRALLADASQPVAGQSRRDGAPSGGAGTGGASTGGAASGGAGAAGAATGGSSSSLNVTVYRPAVATYYGPGFFGHPTACGERLARDTLGVANLQLKCGTMVEIYYRGQSIAVPVIDRGPYAAGVSWDLTEATARALGIVTTVTIGVVAAPVHSGGAGLP